MLNNEIQQASLYKYIETQNELKEKIKEYIYEEEIDIAIALNTRQIYQMNDSDFNSCTYIGITQCGNIAKNDRINDLIVVFVQGHKGNYYVYLNEGVNDGRL